MNGKSLLGLTHKEAVDVLRRSGQSVTVCVRPNLNYRGGLIAELLMFSIMLNFVLSA